MLYSAPPHLFRRGHLSAFVTAVAVLLLITLSGAEAGSASQFSPGSKPSLLAGRFYPASPESLRSMIESFRSKAVLPPELESLTPRAIVLPHAGYVYSGPCAGYGVKALEGRHYNRIILLAPDHRVGFKGVAVTGYGAIETPLGAMPLDPVCSSLAESSDLVIYSEASDRQEHSVEAIIPYLQSALGNIPIVPLTVGRIEPESLVSMADRVREPGDLLVASSDLSHFLSYDQAVAADQDTIDRILSLDCDGFLSKQNQACGRMGIHVLMNLARKYNWKPYLLNYQNSGDTAGDKDRVVGYAVLAFYDDGAAAVHPPARKSLLTQEQGMLLVKLARQTIAKKLALPAGSDPGIDVDKALAAPIFKKETGTFVTLTTQNGLRGCIGNILPRGSMVDSVRDNAVNAAFHDPRFPPLTLREFEDIHIEVSLLTQPEKLDYADADDLKAKLKPGIHGVILQSSWHQATFLPQVWKQLPDPEEFLTRLSRKAGLKGNAWKQTHLEILTYEVEYYDEHPTGNR